MCPDLLYIRGDTLSWSSILLSDILSKSSFKSECFKRVSALQIKFCELTRVAVIET